MCRCLGLKNDRVGSWSGDNYALKRVSGQRRVRTAHVILKLKQRGVVGRRFGTFEFQLRGRGAPLTLPLRQTQGVSQILICPSMIDKRVRARVLICPISSPPALIC
jgi:hypothetical protein